jgi:hypothetical protein
MQLKRNIQTWDVTAVIAVTNRLITTMRFADDEICLKSVEHPNVFISTPTTNLSPLVPTFRQAWKLVDLSTETSSRNYYLEKESTDGQMERAFTASLIPKRWWISIIGT